MSVVQLDFFAANDLNGSVLFSIDDEDTFFEALAIRPSLKDLGVGKLTLNRKVGAAVFDNGAFQPEVFVRVLVPAISETDYIWGFFLDLRNQVLISTDEGGGEKFELGGPGPAFYLTRAILWDEQFSGAGWRIDRDNGIFVFTDDTVGNALSVLLNEDQANTIATFLPDLTDGFSSANDSAGNAWGADYQLDDDFELEIGKDYLEHIWHLQDACPELDITFDLGTVATPIFKLDAWQGYGRDLSGGAFGAGVVLFKEAVNIETQLVASGTSLRFASHALVRGMDGAWGRAVRSTWDPGEYVKAITYDYSNKNENLLDRAGLRLLRKQEHNTNEFDFEIRPGFDESSGYYFPGPDGTNGHFWLGDTVTLLTGGDVSWTPLDYRFEEQRVTGLTMELREAAKDDTTAEAALSWTVRPMFNVERGSDNRPSNNSGGGGRNTLNPRLCPALTPGEETATRLYFTSSATPLTASAGWTGGSTDLITTNLATTPSGSGGTSVSWDAVNQSAAAFALVQGRIALSNAALLAAVQSGGDFRVQARVGIRHGIGINEGAHREYLEGCIRVYRPGTASFIGTMLAVGDATSTIHAENDTAGTVENRSMSGALTGVPTAVSTDVLVVELGLQHDAPTTGGAGGSVSASDSAGVDLPEDDTTTTDGNAWVELRTTTEPTGSGNHPDLVGTSVRAARCDHKHHVIRERTPTSSDDATQGYPTGTYWVYVDDEEDPTEIIATYLLVDNTEDAAVWVLQGASNTHTHDTSTLPWVNVLDYGADPSGTDDSLAAFDDALDSVDERAAALIVPPGTYLLSGPLLLGNSTVILGVGSNMSDQVNGMDTLTYHPQSVLYFNNDTDGIISPDDAAVTYRCHHPVIQNITIKGGGAAQGNRGIWLRDNASSSVSIQRVGLAEVRDCFIEDWGTAIDFDGTADSCKVIGGHIHDCDQGFVGGVSEDVFERVCVWSLNVGPAVSLTGDRGQVIGCEIEPIVGSGIVVSGDFNRIVANDVKDIPGTAIDVSGDDNTIVANTGSRSIGTYYADIGTGNEWGHNTPTDEFPVPEIVLTAEDVSSVGRWEPVTNGVDTFVWDGDEIVVHFVETP